MRLTINDIDDVERIIGHPSVFEFAKDDADVSPLDIAVTALRDKTFIIVRPHEDTLFMFRRMNLIMFEMHVCIVDGPARKQGLKSAVEAARWLFENTECMKIVSHIPAFHAASLMFAKVCGMKEEGRLSKAYKKNGELHDLVILGATREEYEKLYTR